MECYLTGCIKINQYNIRGTQDLKDAYKDRLKGKVKYRGVNESYIIRFYIIIHKSERKIEYETERESGRKKKINMLVIFLILLYEMLTINSLYKIKRH